MRNNVILECGILWRLVQESVVLEGRILHLCIYQYGIVSDVVEFAWRVVDLEEERQARG